MATLWSETWAQANGTSPTTVTPGLSPAGSSATVQTGHLRMTTGTGTYGPGRVARRAVMPNVADVEVTSYWRPAAASEQYARVAVRASNDIDGTGYFLNFERATGICWVDRAQAFSYTVISPDLPTGPITAGTVVRFRFRAVGSALKVKVWLDGATEPSTWTWQGTDTAITAAGAVGTASWAGSATQVADWGPLTITDATADPTPPAAPTGQTLYSSDFTGANGASPTGLVEGYSLSGASATIHDNQLRLTTGTAAYGPGTLSRRVNIAAVADAEVYFEYTRRNTTGYQELHVGVRADTNVDVGAGYYLRLDPGQGTWRVTKAGAFVETTIGTTQSFSIPTGTKVKARLRVIGTSIQAKVWIGDTEPVAWPVSLTDTSIPGAGAVGFRLRSDVGGSVADLDTFIVTNGYAVGGNTPPTANAGPDKTVAAGGLVQLDGSGSDPEGAVSFAWAVPAGFEIAAGQGTATPTIRAPSVTADTSGVVTLTVTDIGGLTATDTVTINVIGSVLKVYNDAFIYQAGKWVHCRVLADPFREPVDVYSDIYSNIY